MKKLTILILIIILTSLAIAIPQILYSTNTIPYGNCGDTDADGNLNTQFKNKGSVAGKFQGDFHQNGTNQTISGVFTDYCKNSTILTEFTCGSSFSQQYSGLAGALQFDCTELGNYSCVQGACILTQNQTTNLSLQFNRIEYELFNTGILDTTKWIETPTPTATFTDEHYINNFSQRYVIAQNSPAHRGTMLTFNRTFSPGEVLVYDVYYNNASGNSQQGCRINGNYCSQSGITPNNSPGPGSGMIGYWNGLTDIGNATGKYKIVEIFRQNEIKQYVRSPAYNNIFFGHRYNSVMPPYNFAIFSHTGHNGQINNEYDNFYIYRPNNQQNSLPLVAMWYFDEGEYQIAMDYSENNHWGFLTNQNMWTNNSIFGHAIEIGSGGIDYITMLPTMINLTQQVEIEAWIKRSNNYDGTIVSKNKPFFLAVRGNKIYGGIYTNNVNCPANCTTPGANNWTEIQGTTILQTEIWYKAKMRYDGSSVSLYVNDMLENSVIKTGQMPIDNLRPTYIGYGEFGHADHFNGIIDEVSIRGY